MMQEDRNGWMKISFTFSKSGWIGYLGRNLDPHFSRGTFKIGNIMGTFPYKVTFVGRNMTLGFSEVSGLTQEFLVTAPQHQGVPAAHSFPNIVCIAGLVLCSNEVLECINATKTNSEVPGTVLIQQFNEKGAVLQEWKLQDAQIAKFIYAGAARIGNNIAISQLGLVYKGAGSEARKGGGSHW